MPRLIDPTDRYRIGPPNNSYQTMLQVQGATSIVFGRDGVRRGVYVDNETPGRAAVCAEMLKLHVGLVFVGLYPDEEKLHIPGCINMLELYPWHDYTFMSVPRAGRDRGFIVQRDYALPGERPPTLRQTRWLTAKAWTRLPRAVWWY